MITGSNTKIIKFLSGILACLCMSVSFASPVFAAPASDPLASAKTQAVLDYLTDLPGRADKRVVSGQHTYVSDNLIENIHTATGKYVGLVGIDYFYQNNSTTNNKIIAWSNANSLITIAGHWNNPVTGTLSNPSSGSGAGTAWDKTYVDFVQLITDGTALNTNFKTYLDSIASGLQTLQNNNVVVLFRPFHEMNGSWFWWGGKDATQYKNAWIYMYNYMTKTKGLHNLLWVYSPFAHYDMTKYYPGAQYVDVVGMDVYDGASLTDTADYNALTALGKPFGITEYGPCSTNGCGTPTNWSSFITSLKTAMPKAAFWMSWAGSWSMYYNTGTSTVLNDPWVITRDEIVLPVSGGSQPPAVPAGLRIVTTP